jgi:hypothetical protein
MATTNILQKLDPVTDPLVTGTVGSTTTTLNRSQTETFLAGAAITLGQWVAFDATKTGADRVLYVIPAANVALGNALTVGVARAAQATVGGKVDVVIAGLCPVANVDAGVAAAGVPLAVVAAGAGIAAANVAANIAQPCGVSLAASAAGVAPVWVIKSF